MIGQTLAHYGFEGLLGEGGSGVVYRGRDLVLERPVAIKVLADALRDDELAWARLLREARLASQLNHPNIAAIHELGEDDGRAYIVMEYVEGLPLSDLIPEGGMPREQVERYATQICDALAHAHQHGTLHGDLKGSNIMVTPEGNIKLLDFGLGRRIPHLGAVEVSKTSLPLAQVGATAGTLPYVAPEVLRGNPTSVQSDVWSLGVLLYQMVTGDLPFQGATSFELSVAIIMGTPTNLWQLPEPLQSTLSRAMEKDPIARFPQVSELSDALQRPPNAGSPTVEAVAEIESPATPPAAEAALPHLPEHRKWWAAGGAAMLTVLLMGGVYARHIWPRPHPTPSTTVPAASKIPQPARKENPDATVWVNTDSGTYHCAGTRWYGKTHEGKFMPQNQAKEKGYRPAANHGCS